VAVGVLGASILLHLRDPHASGSYGFCPWLIVTGTYCPGCGGLRAVNDLTRGDLASAASSNLLFVGSIPLLVLLWARWLRDRWAGDRWAADRPSRDQGAGARRPVGERRALAYGAAALAVAIAFAIARNTPWGGWLAP
jgi:hypothetical protein